MRIDYLAFKRYRIPPILLMDYAGKAVADFIDSKYRGKQVCILIGKGNNGGDGLVAARHLHRFGYKLSIILTFEQNSLSKESLTYSYLQMVKKLKGIKFYFNCSMLAKAPKNSVLVDALYGIGLNRKLAFGSCQLIDYVNHQVVKRKMKVIGVDIPSGLHPDLGVPFPLAVKCDYTLTMGFMKKGFMSPQSKFFTGKVVLCDIGYPAILNLKP